MQATVPTSHTSKSAKLELAETWGSNKGIITNLIEEVFQNAIERIEQDRGKKVEQVLKKTIWDKTFDQQFKSLEDFLVIEVYTKYLGSFSEKEAKEMLDDYRRVGSILNNDLCKRLDAAEKMFQKESAPNTENKLLSMTQDWVTIIERELKK